jgi:CheY-like chemotaxis protein
MRISRFRVLTAAFVLLFASLAVALPADLVTVSVNSRTYLPGDFVHVVVEAPDDTAQISAALPDGSTANLVQDRRSNVWRGIWQVPIDFKRGTYSAKLTAIDVQGNPFIGQTDPFTIGELSLVTLVGKPSAEAAPPKPAAPAPQLREVITAVAAPAPTISEEALITLIKKIVTPAAPPPVPKLGEATRDRLVANNLAAGQESVRQGRFSEAAAFFRVVLYLAPENPEAGKGLADAQVRLAAQKSAATARFYLILAALGFGLLVLAVALFYLVFLPRRNLRLPQAAPAPLSEQEKEAFWFGKMGWRGDPFAAETARQLFAGGGRLESDSLRSFLKTTIEAAGGRGLEPFTEAALDLIYDLSNGNPKVSLEICAWSLKQAIGRGEFAITAELVKGYEAAGRRRILIADDEEIIRSSLEAILRRGGGYETDFAEDGEEALRKMKENPYDLVLLDIDMPKLDGYNVLKQIRKLYPELPIVFVTGKGDPQETIDSIAQLGLNSYIQKPFSLEKVLDTVARLIRK